MDLHRFKEMLAAAAAVCGADSGYEVSRQPKTRRLLALKHLF